jgi:glutaredoxin/glutathione-dependent peroxiredoxin
MIRVGNKLPDATLFEYVEGERRGCALGPGRNQHTSGKVRMMADGSVAFTRALGLEQDLSARGMGIRSQRYAMVVDDGVVKTLRVEAPGKFEMSDAASVLATLSQS